MIFVLKIRFRNVLIYCLMKEYVIDFLNGRIFFVNLDWFCMLFIVFKIIILLILIFDIEIFN